MTASQNDLFPIFASLNTTHSYVCQFKRLDWQVKHSNIPETTQNDCQFKRFVSPVQHPRS